MSGLRLAMIVGAIIIAGPHCSRSSRCLIGPMTIPRLDADTDFELLDASASEPQFALVDG